MSRRLRWAGENGLLVEVEEGESPRALADWLRADAQGAGLEEVVPGARTVLAVGPPEVLAVVAPAVIDAPPLGGAARTGRVVEVEVVYGGPDLERVCARSGLEPAAVVTAHTGAAHHVDFFGFSPGLALLAGVPETLRVPRLDNPRTIVPGGSVAIANGYSVVYPGGTPGGWNVIGHAVGPPLWDVRREPPHLVEAGDEVRFRAVPGRSPQ